MAISRSSLPNVATMSERLANALPCLDGVARKLHAVADPVFGASGSPTVKDALYGTWLGHPLHPVMTDLPMGFWTSSVMLDLLGMEKAADATLKAGTISALGAAATGYAQWHDLQEMDTPRRMGTLHALVNVGATATFGLSWLLRSRDHRAAGVMASAVGLSLASVGGLLGGDLSFKLGIGVSRLAFEEPASEWSAVIPLNDVEDGHLTRVEHVSGPLVLLRTGDEILAASATCTHVGAPLDEGERDGTCVTCPWHGSQFDLRDGSVVHGPATAPLHAFATRVVDGQVEIRLRAS